MKIIYLILCISMLCMSCSGNTAVAYESEPLKTSEPEPNTMIVKLKIHQYSTSKSTAAVTEQFEIRKGTLSYSLTNVGSSGKGQDKKEATAILSDENLKKLSAFLETHFIGKETPVQTKETEEIIQISLNGVLDGKKFNFMYSFDASSAVEAEIYQQIMEFAKQMKEMI